MAVLGFVSIAINLVTTQYVATTTGCVMAPNCFEKVEVAAAPTLILAALNAAIWFGIVYLIFLVFYGIRKVTGRGPKPAPAVVAVEATPEADKPAISPEA